MMIQEQFNILYQSEPQHARPFRRRVGLELIEVTPKGWTTVEGYLNEADNLVACVQINHRLGQQYRWIAVINFSGQLVVDEHKIIWGKISRKLRQAGLVALCIREISRKGSIHYHLLGASNHTPEQAKSIICIALSGYGRCWTATPKDWVWWMRYSIKAQVSGWSTTRSGRRWVEDVWAGKRVYFQRKVGLDKFTTIGPFWLKPKKQIWQEVCDRKAKIAKTLETHPEIRQYAKHIYHLLNDGQACELVPIERIERSYALHPPEAIFHVAKPVETINSGPDCGEQRPSLPQWKRSRSSHNPGATVVLWESRWKIGRLGTSSRIERRDREAVRFAFSVRTLLQNDRAMKPQCRSPCVLEHLIRLPLNAAINVVHIFK